MQPTLWTPIYYRFFAVFFGIISVLYAEVYLYVCIFESKEGDSLLFVHISFWTIFPFFIGMAGWLFSSYWYKVFITNESIIIQKPFNKLEILRSDWLNTDINDNRQIFKTSDGQQIQISLLPTDFLLLKQIAPFLFRPAEIKLPYRLRLNQALNLILLVLAILFGIGIVFLAAHKFSPAFIEARNIFMLLAIMLLGMIIFIRSRLIAEIQFDKAYVAITYFTRRDTYIEPVFQNLAVVTKTDYSMEGKTEMNELSFRLEKKTYAIIGVNTDVSLLHLEEFIKANYPVT